MAFDRRMPRIQAVVLPVLRAELVPVWPGLKVGSWVEAVKQRSYPLINVRRFGGLPHARLPDQLGRPVIELTAYSDVNEIDTENLCLDALKVLQDMVSRQTVVPGVGHLHSYFETLGPTQFDSPYEGAWRVQSLIQLGLRPEPTTP